MGKSSNSCLKIITCGGAGDSSDNEELAPSETKSSSEKRRWSFRNKSAGHRVLSNSVTSEPVSATYNKETPETAPTTFDSPIHLSIPEKTRAEDKQRETPLLQSDVFDVEETYTQVSDKNTPLDDNKQNSDAVVIQASARRYLAQKELVKLKNVVKLQSAIRGHLVRREAVETLRCAQAIVKIQAFVRVHHACQLAQKSAAKEVKKPESALLGKGKRGKTHLSIQILLSNGFAEQLLESMPKTKTFHIKCDSSSSDSSWKWLERWMTVTSSSIQEHKLPRDNQESLEEDSNLATCRLSNEVAAAQVSAKPEDGDGDLINNTFGSFEFKAPFNYPSSAEKYEQDEDRFFGAIKSNHTKNEDITMHESSFCFSDHKPLHSHENEISQPLCDVESEIEINTGEKHDDRRESSETEGKRFAFGLRRTCNPAFIAAQSKFEELSSAQSASRSIQSKSDTVHSQVNASLMKTKDQTLLDNSTADSRIQMASSECGTEISISSTLDSPDRSEAEGGEIVLEIGPVEKENYAASIADDGNMFYHEKSLNAEANKLTQTNTEGEGNKAGLMGIGDLVLQVEKQQIEPTSSDLQTHLENMRDQQPVYRSSPEGSPRSHATALESHGTPSSQISVGTKKSKKDNNMPARKHKSQTAVTRSPSTPNSDSSSREQKSKDTKNGKKRSSLPAVPKPDTVEHEPRISSSNSLPSYMQATKSARAKAQASTAPKASPDTHDKDHLQKRHSLPMANGKQDSSPRMQRSTSQAQNVTERRWQR